MPLSTAETIHTQTDSHARDLGAFLRARRESMDPERLGLPRFSRRRTPGLRREEVAQLANVSVTWYTWLEQGRTVQASSKALAAIASALECNPAETRHIFALARQSPPADTNAALACPFGQATQTILDHLDPLPGLFVNTRFDILGYNAAYCRLINVDLQQVAPDERNCIYLAFANARCRASLADWDLVMPRMVGLFRAAMAEHLNDPSWQWQLERYFSQFPEFHDIWQKQEVRGIENHIKRFQHPGIGILSLKQTNWWTAADNGDRLSVYVPLDAHSEHGLRQLPTP